MGYNFIGDITYCSISTLTNVGTDILNQESMLMDLADHGGPNRTHLAAASSLVINGGNLSGCTDHNASLITKDQRGETRPRSARCDIGAVEHYICDDEQDDLVLTDINISNVRLDQACGSITIEGDSFINRYGDQHFLAPSVSFGPGFTVSNQGKLRVSSMAPDLAN